MNLKKVKIAFIIVIALIILNLAFIVLVFHNQTISTDLSDWANFANYLGNTTNILISFLTLFVTFFIAYEITKIESNRNKLNLEYDNRKFKRELREKEYALITDNLNNIWFGLIDENKKNASQTFYAIRTRFVTFLRHKRHLFPGLNIEKFNELDETLVAILEHSSGSFEKDHPEILRLIDKYQKELAEFHKTMQDYIITH